MFLQRSTYVLQEGRRAVGSYKEYQQVMRELLEGQQKLSIVPCSSANASHWNFGLRKLLMSQFATWTASVCCVMRRHAAATGA